MPSSVFSATTSGPAFRVSILGPQHAESYENVHAFLDSAHHVVHVFSADAQTHYLTIPLSFALVEWRDASALNPQPYVPGFGAGAFERMGEYMQKMSEGMGRAFAHGDPPAD